MVSVIFFLWSYDLRYNSNKRERKNVDFTRIDKKEFILLTTSAPFCAIECETIGQM